jgi:hypothetical protein
MQGMMGEIFDVFHFAMPTLLALFCEGLTIYNLSRRAFLMKKIQTLHKQCTSGPHGSLKSKYGIK